MTLFEEAQEIAKAAFEKQILRPCVLYRPEMSVDTTTCVFTAKYGCIEGCGYTAEEAMVAFDEEWRRTYVEQTRGDDPMGAHYGTNR